MQTITAIYVNGVLKPMQPLDLPEHTEVRLTIEVISVPKLLVGDLNAFLKSLPSLGDDADAFAQDIRDVLAMFPAEADPWD